MQSRKQQKPRQKPISLHPLTFEEAVGRILLSKPKDKAKKNPDRKPEKQK